MLLSRQEIEKIGEDNAKDIGADIFTMQSRIFTAIVNTRDKQVLEEIKKHFKNKYKDEYVDIALLDEQIVDEIIRLGIAEYKKEDEQ